LENNLIITTTSNIDGYRITEYLGIVRGLDVRVPTFSQGIIGGIKSIVGGQIDEYYLMCDDARQEAFELMLKHAIDLEADAVVGILYDTSDIGGDSGGTEVLCYGTAVKIEKII